MSFWRKETPEIITQKEFALSRDLITPPKKTEHEPAVTTGGMFPTHRKWWESDAFYKFLVGGYGSGKSMALGKRMTALSIINAPYPCMIVSPTYKMAKRTTIPMIKALLNGRRVRHKYHASDHVFTIHHKGHVERERAYQAS